MIVVSILVLSFLKCPLNVYNKRTVNEAVSLLHLVLQCCCDWFNISIFKWFDSFPRSHRVHMKAGRWNNDEHLYSAFSVPFSDTQSALHHVPIHTPSHLGQTERGTAVHKALRAFSNHH